MAEIKIEKKKPIWPWIVAVVLIAALVYFFFLKDKGQQVQNRTEIENTTSIDTTAVDTTAN